MTDPEVPQTEKSSRSKAPLIVGGLVVVAIVVAGVFWLLRDDAPDEVNLDDAVAQVSTTTEAADTGDTGDTGSDDGSSTTGVAADGIEGEWTVDTETGEFDYESATGSFVGFRIDESWPGGRHEAVGRTGDVSGGITIEGTTVSGLVRVDLTTITTNEPPRRPGAVGAGHRSVPHRHLRAHRAHRAGAGAADGETVTATAVGDSPSRAPPSRSRCP
jgi:hypothetical protein